MKFFSGSSIKKGGLLAHNTLINVMGKGIPLIFAIISIPFLIKGLGTERFGVLTIIWTVVGYFGLFDMGLGRATTKFVADQKAQDAGQLSPIIVTSILMLIGFGIIGGLVIFIATPYLVNNLLNISAGLTKETQRAFYILSVSIPVVLGSIGARGVLEAQQRFALVNAVKIPATIINYVGPLLVLLFSNKLHYVVLLLVFERCISFIIYLYYSFQGQKFIKLSDYSFLRWAKKLLGFGAWLTVSNFISPIMVYMDRFIIGAILTMSAVAYYTTPYEIVSRLGIISSGFMGVMFPAFSVYFLDRQRELIDLYQKSIRYLLFILIPIVVFLIFAANPLLYLWLGNEFAQNSSSILQILAVGVLINCIAMVPSTIIQAAGRPDIRAKLHMAELPIYLALLWYLTYKLGITGVALAWLIRVSIDCSMMFYFSNRIITFLNIAWSQILYKIALIVLAISVAMSVFWWVSNTIIILFYALVCGSVALYITWHRMLKQAERNQIGELILEMRARINV